MKKGDRFLLKHRERRLPPILVGTVTKVGSKWTHFTCPSLSALPLRMRPVLPTEYYEVDIASDYAIYGVTKETHEKDLLRSTVRTALMLAWQQPNDLPEEALPRILEILRDVPGVPDAVQKAESKRAIALDVLLSGTP